MPKGYPVAGFTHRQTEATRKLIQANRLIVRLQQFVLGRKFQGEPVHMSGHQVRAALGLLNKVLPDLTKTELSGEGGGPIPFDLTGKVTLYMPDNGRSAPPRGNGHGEKPA